ncbi:MULTISPECIES: plasmid transfer protein [Pedobacter]|uniref:Plasmid transfer protein n=1 Tax=Pedobacter roseus TaxID=336820 RepID=A0A7G9QHA8_9SPHI|nr:MULTISPECIES: plasmid transfer protein [Pedobacter]MCX2575736.1 plasmid transfer protein [Pedobacter sandarakinus]QNN42733.1 plasmid transfer protein [Pedobacter roseus]
MDILNVITGTAGFFVQSVPDSFKDTFNFLQGNGVYEEGMMHFLHEMKNTIWTHYDAFIADAQALAAIFMLIFFAIKSYEMISGDKQLEIMPLLRPFGLTMVILWWSIFTRVIAYPTDVIEQKTSAMFDGSQTEINDLRLQRAKLMVEVSDQLYKIQAETQTAKTEADTWYENAWESVKSSVKEGFSEVWNPIVEMRNRLEVGLQLLATSLLETLAIWILRVCTYIIFIIQIIFSTILIILGPFSVAVSILPAFRDSFSTWVARFISVNLYSGIAYLVMYVASLFQHYALEAEITRYQELVGTGGASLEKLGWFASNGVLSFGMVIVTFIIGALTMLTVPSISTWIVSTSGVSSAASSMGRGASSMTRVAGQIMGG